MKRTDTTRNVFPQAAVGTYCSLWKHTQNNALQKCYMSDSQFALHLCMTVTLSILPPKNIINCFDQLCLLIRNEYLGDVDNKRDYFEETYIDRLSKSLWARTNKQQG